MSGLVSGFALSPSAASLPSASASTPSLDEVLLGERLSHGGLTSSGPAHKDSGQNEGSKQNEGSSQNEGSDVAEVTTARSSRGSFGHFQPGKRSEDGECRCDFPRDRLLSPWPDADNFAAFPFAVQYFQGKLESGRLVFRFNPGKAGSRVRRHLICGSDGCQKGKGDEGPWVASK